MAAFVGLVGHLYYSVFYTMYLKMKTDQNIVLGGAAGAVGPLIGWAAVTGGLSWIAWAQFALIFLWTPPHFWALALKYSEDYARAGVPMYPVTQGADKTIDAIFLYSLSLLGPVAVLFLFDAAGLFFFVISSALTFKFIREAYVLRVCKTKKQGMKLFHYSCLYTFLIFGALGVDALQPLMFSQVWRLLLG